MTHQTSHMPQACVPQTCSEAKMWWRQCQACPPSTLLQESQDIKRTLSSWLVCQEVRVLFRRNTRTGFCEGTGKRKSPDPCLPCSLGDRLVEPIALATKRASIWKVAPVLLDIFSMHQLPDLSRDLQRLGHRCQGRCAFLSASCQGHVMPDFFFSCDMQSKCSRQVAIFEEPLKKKKWF